MGRPEGTGCYCFANDLLKTCMGLLGRDYRFIVIDNEAGMEHLSRGTIGIPDLLLVVSDPGARGMRTAIRIRDLARSLGLSTVPILLVLNRWRGSRAEVAPGGVEVAAVIPEDPAIEEADLAGTPVGFQKPGSPARTTVEQLAREIIRRAQERPAG